MILPLLGTEHNTFFSHNYPYLCTHTCQDTTSRHDMFICQFTRSYRLKRMFQYTMYMCVYIYVCACFITQAETHGAMFGDACPLHCASLDTTYQCVCASTVLYCTVLHGTAFYRLKRMVASLEMPGCARPHPWVTPLHLAARAGCTPITVLLLSRGALPDGGPSRGLAKRTPLQEAIMYARSEWYYVCKEWLP